MVYKAGPVLNIHQKSHIKQNSFLTLIQNDIKPEQSSKMASKTGCLFSSHLKLHQTVNLYCI